MSNAASNPFKVAIGEPWTAPYPVPTTPGQVVVIAGDATSTLGHGSGGSQYPTNVFGDVRPPEVGSAKSGNQMLFTGDTRTKFIASYGVAGAIVIAGSGGHKGTPCYGAALFDLNDGRWKRVWTTQGNPGVDNVTNQDVDLRTGTTTHGCPNLERDNIECYQDDTTSGGVPGVHPYAGKCFNPDHWSTNGGTTSGGGSQAHQRAACPITADPRDQTWEVSIPPNEPNVTKTDGHGWPLPIAEFNGLQRSAAFPNGRFEFGGYMTESLNFHPPVAGTLEPTQSEIPAPAHIWDHYYELTPAQGGGPKGSIVTGRHFNIGEVGVTSCPWTHRFDLHTGIWHKFSTNSPLGGNAPVVGGPPSNQSSAVAGAQDPVADRAFLIGKRISDTGSFPYVNYMNMADRTWRNFHVGTGGVIPTDRTENLFVDPDRRLLIVCSNLAPYLFALDLQTLGQTGTAEPTPSQALGGWKPIPFDDIEGEQSFSPYSGSATEPSHNGGHNTNQPWRYYPPNGKFYRVNSRTRANTPGSANYSPERPDVTVLQRLTPPPIVATPRSNFYYTTEASSGRWTLDEIQMNDGNGNRKTLPVCDPAATYAVCGFTWFHYAPALQCFVYAPMDFSSGGSTNAPTVRRSVFLIKPF